MATGQSSPSLFIYTLCKSIIVFSFTISLFISPSSTFMGCGNSKLIPEGEAVPPAVRPLLRRRFLEMRKRRNDNVLKQGGLSKKQLLKDGGDEDDDNSSPPRSEVLDCKSTSSSLSSSSKRKEKPETGSEAIEELKEQEDDKDVETRGCSEKEEAKEEAKDKQKNQEEVKEKDEEEEDSDDDDGPGAEDERRICPGSPSFRVFFLEATENEKEKAVIMADPVAEEEEDDSSDKKTQSDDSFVSTASNEGRERKVSKKGGRGRALKRAIKKGGPVAVKNLLNVKSCYHPATHTHDRATLLEAKAAAA